MSLFGSLGKLAQGAQHIVSGVAGGVAKGTGAVVSGTATGVSKAVGLTVDVPATGIEELVTPLVAHVATAAGTGVGTALLVKRLGMPPAEAVAFGALVGGISGQVVHLYFHHDLAAVFGRKPATATTA